MNESSPVSWIAWLLVAVAIIALLVLARGTPDHSRYDDAPASARIGVIA
ncbi:MAG TPA: hypothetical protein VI277_01955 [Candidatus Limnocylindria bacterium]